jgi:hypothetical protein
MKKEAPHKHKRVTSNSYCSKMHEGDITKKLHKGDITTNEGDKTKLHGDIVTKRNRVEALPFHKQ